MSLAEQFATFGIDGETAIDVADTLQDVWEVGGLIDLSIADGPIDVVSDSALDTLAGTGARRIVIRGNAAGALPEFQNEEIDMNGTGSVQTTQSFQGHSIAQARVIDSDDLFRIDLPIGTITLTQGGNVVGKILPARLQTHHGFRRIPYGPGGQLQRWIAAGGDISILDLAGKTDAEARLELWTMSPGDQAHTDGAMSMSAVTGRESIIFNESFESGETFAVRISCDQNLVEFRVNLIANVFRQIQDHEFAEQHSIPGPNVRVW